MRSAASVCRTCWIDKGIARSWSGRKPPVLRGATGARALRMGHVGEVGNLRLAPGSAVHGRVLDPDGAPLANVEVRIKTIIRVRTPCGRTVRHSDSPAIPRDASAPDHLGPELISYSSSRPRWPRVIAAWNWERTQRFRIWETCGLSARPSLAVECWTRVAGPFLAPKYRMPAMARARPTPMRQGSLSFVARMPAHGTFAFVFRVFGRMCSRWRNHLTTSRSRCSGRPKSTDR